MIWWMFAVGYVLAVLLLLFMKTATRLAWWEDTLEEIDRLPEEPPEGKRSSGDSTPGA